MNLYNKELLCIGVAIVGLCIIQQLFPRKEKEKEKGKGKGKEGFADTATTVGLSFFLVIVLGIVGSIVIYMSYNGRR